jgi:phosphopantetheinyl transferase
VNERPDRLTFTAGPHGKPSLTDRAGPVESVRFNLAHSDDSALIAVARDREVGVDVETKFEAMWRAWGSRSGSSRPGEFRTVAPRAE